MSAIAMSLPIFKSWPCRAHGPDSGVIEAILTVLACARTIPGAANAPAAAAMPAVTLRLVMASFVILVVSFSIRGSGHPLQPFLPEIGLDHAPVPHHLAGRSLGDQAAMVKHGEVVDEVH